MSLMNLQKLRQICYRENRQFLRREHSLSYIPAMTINLPPNDPLNRVIVNYRDQIGQQKYTVQINSIKKFDDFFVEVNYSSQADIPNLKSAMTAIGKAVVPRLHEILTEHGFHSSFLPKSVIMFDPKLSISFKPPSEFINQIICACYNDGASLRKALKYQARINQS